jgi:hypothetical protein
MTTAIDIVGLVIGSAVIAYLFMVLADPERF